MSDVEVYHDADGGLCCVIDRSENVIEGDEVWLKGCSQPFTAWRSGNEERVYLDIPFWNGSEGSNVFIESRFFSHAVRRFALPEKTGLYLGSDGSLVKVIRGSSMVMDRIYSYGSVDSREPEDLCPVLLSLDQIAKISPLKILDSSTYHRI